MQTWRARISHGSGPPNVASSLRPSSISGRVIAVIELIDGTALVSNRYGHSVTHVDAARGDSVWIVCSADKACVSAAVALGWHERMHSLGALAAAVGANPNPPLGRQFGEPWLSEVRTRYLLGA